MFSAKDENGASQNGIDGKEDHEICKWVILAPTIEPGKQRSDTGEQKPRKGKQRDHSCHHIIIGSADSVHDDRAQSNQNRHRGQISDDPISKNGNVSALFPDEWILDREVHGANDLYGKVDSQKSQDEEIPHLGTTIVNVGFHCDEQRHSRSSAPSYLMT